MLITGVLLQSIISLRASNMDASIIESGAKGGPPIANMDHLLEESHFQMLWTFGFFVGISG
jgi:hypothetical protein